ncbi:nodulation protein NfeD [Ramlibacter sp. G-1-2-2]|uniref:Nodulation protein NfeD n=1 Tax=Ramlibacter agri TaxID=2728837 RepID=A0A848HB32_9BURK|nr:nodulation protein NfeD [Ramlibacter agri]NML45683.1 nodulation protein NfeD [Ramlibacter agri]
MGPFRRALAWLAAMLLAAAAHAAPVLVLEVQDAIGPASASYMLRGIARAEAEGAPLLVIRLDTPGGLDLSMRQVIQAILASRVPVAVYVSPEGARAASAGTYILYAAHIAAMAPATTLGAATPVAIGIGGERKPAAPASAASAVAGPADPMTAKQVHDAAAYIRGLAQQRGRNAEWAERAVREAVTLTASEAVREHVVDLVAKDVPDLLAQVDGRKVQLQDREVTLATRGAATERLLPDWRQRLLSVIANPSLALMLLMIGLYGLAFEFMSPGLVAPGVIGGICLLLALFALQMLPVNYAGLGLIVLGMLLLAAEIAAPSFVLGAGGAVALLAGGLLLFDRDVPGMAVPLVLILELVVASVGFVLLAGGMAWRARRRPVVTGVEEMIGASGVVLPTEPAGAWAQVRGERWRVASPEPLHAGQRVRVTALRGLTLDVLPEPESPGGPR